MSKSKVKRLRKPRAKNSPLDLKASPEAEALFKKTISATKFAILEFNKAAHGAVMALQTSHGLGLEHATHAVMAALIRVTLSTRSVLEVNQFQNDQAHVDMVVSTLLNALEIREAVDASGVRA